MSLSGDRRWRRFTSREFRCPCCGQNFGGVFNIGFDHPAGWPHGSRDKAGVETLVMGDDKLSSDLCIIGDERYIRCTLPIPIAGSDEEFRFGPWASLKPENFDRYVAAWAGHDYSGIDGCFGWLCNTLPGVGMDGDPLPCNVTNFVEDQRPELWVHEGAHPLARMQRDGIGFDQLLDIYAASGTDIRPHLGDA